MLHRSLSIPPLLLTAVLMSCADTESPDATSVAVASGSIVGGTPETRAPAVGALTIHHPGWGYGGAFCTGTLIAPQRVLTAASCFDDGPPPQLVSFYVGPDARPSGEAGPPTSGTLHRADAIVIHPDYDIASGASDIAVVHLQDITTVASGMAIMGGVSEDDAMSQDVLYIGYGVSNDLTLAGGGLRRSTMRPILAMESAHYISDSIGGDLCFGDSGAPGLLTWGSPAPANWAVLGVTSAFGGTEEHPCGPLASHTRVDHFSTWLALLHPTCDDTPGMCLCPDACLPSGACDDTLCERTDCSDLNDCFFSCGAADRVCRAGCWIRGTELAREQFDTIYRCAGIECGELDDPGDFRACVSERCATEQEACFPTVTGDATCAELYACVVACPSADLGCREDCRDTGTAAAQEAFGLMLDCWSERCGAIIDDDAWNACIDSECADEQVACFPLADCDIRGGDCPAGTACYPTVLGVNDCFPSDGLDVGAECDPEVAGNTLGCGDGAVCVSIDGDAHCLQMCLGEGDCPPAERCNTPVFEGLDDVGVCLCRDDDGDGVCAPRDCDDTDPARHPDAREVCDNRIDEDCDGQTDEGCVVPCTDLDRDGVCEESDCDDSDPSRFPNATEACANDVDDDCDGQTDEGCTPTDVTPDDPGAARDEGCGAGVSAHGVHPLAPAALLFFALLGLRRSMGFSSGL